MNSSTLSGRVIAALLNQVDELKGGEISSPSGKIQLYYW